MNAPTATDELTGAALRDEGIKAAERGVVGRHPNVLRAAHRWILEAARSERLFTSETLIEHLTAIGMMPADVDKRCLGGVFMSALKADLIQCVGYVPSSRPSRHRAPIAQYRRGVGALWLRPGDMLQSLDEAVKAVGRRRKMAAEAYEAHREEHRRAPGTPAVPAVEPMFGVVDGPSL